MVKKYLFWLLPNNCCYSYRMKAFRCSPPPEMFSFVFLRLVAFQMHILTIFHYHMVKYDVVYAFFHFDLTFVDRYVDCATLFLLSLYLSFSLLRCYRSFNSLVVGLVCVCLINCRSKCLIGAVWIWQRNWRQQRRHKIGNSKRHHHSRNSLNFSQLQTIQIFVPNGTLPKVCLLFLLLCLKEFCVK